MSGMLWLALRRHRAVVTTGAALALALIAFMIYKRFDMIAYVHGHHIEGCSVHLVRCPGAKRPDLNVLEGFDSAYQTPMLVVGRLMLAVPALVGVFVGAPLFAREWESGTYKLVWSQSASRTRWLAAMLGLPAVLTLTCAVALSATYTWWWRGWPTTTRMLTEVNWYDSVPFDVSGPVAVALPLLALFTGAAIGLVLRRVVPAMVATLAVTVGLQFGLTRLRSLLMPRQTLTYDGVSPYWKEAPKDSWNAVYGYLDRAGQRRPSFVGCHWKPDATECLRRHHITGQYVEFTRENALWPVQWAEAGICLGLTAALAAFCFWWLRHRAV